jgi:capsular exopolysaccharide synthesis family protein
MEIRSYFFLLKRWAWLWILGLVLGGAAAYALSAIQPLLYQAKISVVVMQSPDPQGYADPYSVSLTNIQLAQTYSQLLNSGPVIQRLSKKLGYSIKSDQINVNQQQISQSISPFLAVTVENGNPARAAQIANSLLGVFNEYNVEMVAARYSSVEQNLQAQIDQTLKQITDLQRKLQQANDQQSPEISQVQTNLTLYQDIYGTLLNNYETVRLDRLRNTPTLMQIEQAQVPSTPFQPKPVRNALLGGVLGLVLCVGVIFLINYLDDTVKTPEDIDRVLGLPVLGMIGEMEHSKNSTKMVYVGENPRSPIAEAYRVLRTNLEYGSVDQPLQTLLITSVGPEEGKTTTAVNLALIFAQAGKRVMLVDADLRKPNVHRFLQIQNRTGLSDLFLDNPGDVSKVCTWGETSISVVSSGPLPPNPSELLGSEKFKQILNNLKENIDIVILDSAPSVVSDPIVLSSKVDGVIIIIKPGSTKMGAAQIMLEQLQRAGGRVVGAVLNPISRKRSSYSSKYEYYSKYYQSSKGEHYYSQDGEKKPKKKVTQRTSKNKIQKEDPTLSESTK